MDKTIVIGLGSPFVSDDAVGIRAVRMLAEELGESERVVMTEAYAGGMRLMDVMVGFQHAIIVDAMVTEGGVPGTIRSISVEELITTKNTLSSHDTNLAVALETGRWLGLTLPSEISILGVEAVDVTTFSEDLSPEVERALPEVLRRIRALLPAAVGVP